MIQNLVVLIGFWCGLDVLYGDVDLIKMRFCCHYPVMFVSSFVIEHHGW
jgi:hypothetical protein